MKRRTFFLLIGILSWLAVGCGSKEIVPAADMPELTETVAEESVAPAAAPASKPYEGLVYPPLNDLQPPVPERVVLDNGMILFLLEDHELPLIDIVARIRTGSLYEPADKVGLAEITGTVMRTGGTESHTGDELDDILESLAASVEVGISSDSGTAGMSVLKEDLDTGLEILADVLMHPVFREDKIELAKVEHRGAIARRNDDPGAITRREFLKLIYGPDSPYARTTEYDTINRITRDDLVAFHQKYFHPNNVILGVVGDFNAAEIRAKVEKVFAGWEPTDMKVPEMPPVPERRRVIGLVNKSDVNQTNIRMGHIGWVRSNDDYPALVVACQILGIGFSSRLMNTIRVQQGLAYSVGNNYGAGYDVPGVFLIAYGTKSETTVKATKAILAEVERMRTEEVTEEELQRAIDGFMNASVFDYDTQSEILSRAVRYEYYGYPQDFVEQLMEGIRKVTQADVKRVAEEYLHPDEFALIAVGKAEDFDEPLDTLGEVTKLDISIPTPASKPAPEATDEDVAQAEALLEQVIEAHGGIKVLRALQTLVAKGTLKMATPGGPVQMDMKQTLLLPDHIRIDLTIAAMGMTISQVFNGQTGWMVTPQGKAPLTDTQLQEFKLANLRNTLQMLVMAADGTLSFQHLGSEEVDGRPTEVILLQDAEENSIRIYVDTETKDVIKKAYSMNLDQGPVDAEERIDDFREVDGVRFGFHSVVSHGDEQIVEVQLDEVSVNAPVDTNLFDE